MKRITEIAAVTVFLSMALSCILMFSELRKCWQEEIRKDHEIGQLRSRLGLNQLPTMTNSVTKGKP